MLAGRWLWALTSGELGLCTPSPGPPLKICYLLEVVRLRGQPRLGSLSGFSQTPESTWSLPSEGRGLAVPGLGPHRPSHSPECSPGNTEQQSGV